MKTKTRRILLLALAVLAVALAVSGSSGFADTGGPGVSAGVAAGSGS